jgi:hypothetical protein
MTITSLVALESAVLNRTMAFQAQLADIELRAQNVEMYRNYYDGDHPVNLTTEMRKMLNLPAKPNQVDSRGILKTGSEFNDNYAQIVVDTMSDRILLETIEADTEQASAWAEEVLDLNDIDDLQSDVTEATIRDGETFLMVSWDNEEKRVILTHELAYDGVSGMLALYKSADIAEMAAAMKIWNITSESGGITDTVRINVYYPDKITKWISQDGGGFMPFTDDASAPSGEAPWIGSDGAPLGIPVIHFKNRGRQNQGFSELANMIPLQDVLNRVLHSITATSELDAFRIKWIIGAPAPKAIAPGMVVGIAENGLDPVQAASIKLGEWAAGQVAPQLEVARWITGEIGKITRTPAPEFGANDNASGESLKQREIGLIGKVKRFHVKAGNAWTRALDMAWNVQDAFGQTPPPYERFRCKWQDPEIRNDQQTVDNALKVASLVGDKEAIRILAAVFHWTEDDIDRMIEEKRGEKAKTLSAVAGNFPRFNQMQLPLTVNEARQQNPAQQLPPGQTVPNTQVPPAQTMPVQQPLGKATA